MYFYFYYTTRYLLKKDILAFNAVWTDETHRTSIFAAKQESHFAKKEKSIHIGNFYFGISEDLGLSFVGLQDIHIRFLEICCFRPKN